jgi:hypothetical protein
LGEHDHVVSDTTTVIICSEIVAVKELLQKKNSEARKEGLKEGERVAASGTFLLGSEAQLRSALPKWKGNLNISKTKAPAVEFPASVPEPPKMDEPMNKGELAQ